MDKHSQKLMFSSLVLYSLAFVLGSASYAAKTIDLKEHKPSILQKFSSGLNKNNFNIEEISRNIDFNNTLHIRIQENYNGYPIWGADAIVHVPHAGTIPQQDFYGLMMNSAATMNGIFYDDLSTDLVKTPAIIFTEANRQKALQHVILTYEQKVGGQPTIKDQQSNLMVYVDKTNKAHWTYQVSFEATGIKAGEIPAQPIYILDAVSFKVYEEWNNMKTAKHTEVFGGGYGGNQKMGKLIYDGLPGNLGKLNMQRNGQGKCYFQNTEVLVKKCTDFFFNQCFSSEESTTLCANTDPIHNNVYWNGEEDAVNGGYSPTNDALFNGAIIKNMYETWYKVPVLKDPKDPTGKKPMLLTMIVHLPFENAYWDGRTMNFGDGETIFYPLTSLGVAAHEISHGFTTQHSNLIYRDQSGGINEAFSDMAAQAAEYFAFGKNSWQIGPEIFKAEGEALRYMDKPSQDCHGKKPGPHIRCSIDDASQYKSGIDVHYLSGAYNRLFYSLATTSDWDVKKAFDVMVQANANYWTPNSTFASAACGVVSAAKDLGYDTKAVKSALNVVKINYNKC